jgi:EmrB/QacA subfamily drug resistance transporter
MYVGLMLVTVLAALDQTIVATATPSIVSDLGGLSVYSWVFTAYMLASAVTIPLWGKLGDLHGRRRVLLIAISIFVAGSALCGVAPSMPSLIAFRAIQGVGAGGLIPMSLATIASVVPLRERGKFDAFIGVGYATGSVAGPLVGGLLVDHASWRWVFLVSVPLGALALWVIVATVPSLGERHSHTLDWRGAVLLGGATGSLLIGLISAGRGYGWTSTQVLVPLAASVIAGAAFGRIERHAAEPLVPLALLRPGPVATGLLCAGLSGFVMFGAIAYVPLYVQGAMGVSATLSGLALIPMMLGHAGASMVSGIWISRRGRLRPNALAGPLVLACGTLLLWRLTVSSSVAEVAVAMVVAGIGIGLMNQVFLLTVQNSIPNRLLGTGSALVQFSRVIGGSLGIAVLGTIVNRRLPQGSGLEASPAVADLTDAARAVLADALSPVFVVMTAVSLAAFVVVVRGIREMPLSRSVGDEPALALAGLDGGVESELEKSVDSWGRARTERAEPPTQRDRRSE